MRWGFASLLTLVMLIVSLHAMFLAAQQPSAPNDPAQAAGDAGPKPKPLKKIFLPNNMQQAMFMMRRLYSDEEVIGIERREPVYLSFLERSSLDYQYHVEAIDGLARLHKQQPRQEVVEILERFDQAKPDQLGGLMSVTRWLATADPDDLRPLDESWSKLAQTARQVGVRQAAFVGWARSGQDVTRLFAAARQHQHVDDLLEAFMRLGPEDRQGPWIEAVRQEVQSPTDPAAQRTAIRALPLLVGHEAEAFAQLTELLVASTEVIAVSQALTSLPAAAWDTDRLAAVADALVNAIGSFSPDQRSLPESRPLWTLADQVSARLTDQERRPFAQRLDGLRVQHVEIRTVEEQMRYDRDVIVVGAGRNVEIQLINQDVMPHNLVITAPNSWKEVGMAAEQMATAPDAAAKHYVPDSESVLFATPMLPSKQEHRLVFAAPLTPGVYPMVCTFPGHWRRMYGAMIVVEDPQVYLASHAELPTADELLGAPKVVKHWTLADLQPELPRTLNGRSFAEGQRLFLEASCRSCHKMQGEGGLIGPDLTEISKRLQPSEIVQALVEPSAKVDEQYATVIIVTQSGKVWQGVVVEQNDQQVAIKENPLIACDPVVIPRAEIDSLERTKTSPMPSGMLDTLQMDQVLDLVTYILAGGNAAAPQFQ